MRLEGGSSTQGATAEAASRWDAIQRDISLDGCVGMACCRRGCHRDGVPVGAELHHPRADMGWWCLVDTEGGERG